MSANRWTAATVLRDHYRCPSEFDVFKPFGRCSDDAGFFKLGSHTICYGHSACGSVPEPGSSVPDALHHVCIGRDEAGLPFDPAAIIENLRRERYVMSGRNAFWKTLRKPYYALRPLLPVLVRKHLQRAYLKRWRQIVFPEWPVDRTVENIFEVLARFSLEACSRPRMPFVWFWPEGYSGCLIMTHDIETEFGRDYCADLTDIDASFGLKSSFQVVPEERYEVTNAFLDRLRAKGAEINLHGLNHDGKLFLDRRHFLQQASQINIYAKRYNAAGFRSPVMYRNFDWYAELDFSYDMSVPNAAHLDPQRGGCCTVMPYFVGNQLELPLTTTQDYSLFNILSSRSIDLWKQQIDLVLEKHGLLSFNIHPDYVRTSPYREVYQALLGYLKRICEERKIWIALPGEVNKWWRARREMQLALNAQNEIEVAGPEATRAVVAYAHIQGDRIAYEIPQTGQVFQNAFGLDRSSFFARVGL
jgi:hypothetical protein